VAGQLNVAERFESCRKTSNAAFCFSNYNAWLLQNKLTAQNKLTGFVHGNISLIFRYLIVGGSNKLYFTLPAAQEKSSFVF